MRAWKQEDDNAIVELYPQFGPSWEGWAEVLPGRTKNAIAARALLLGVKMTHEARAKVAKRTSSKRFGEQRDPMEDEVVRSMSFGRTLAEIDSWHHWVPGTAKRVLMSRWKRIDA